MRITQKHLNSAMKSFRMGLDGICYNDDWNVAHFGMTNHDYGMILWALREEYGMCIPYRPALRAVNARLAAV